jgi:hypothetical protein
MLNDSRHLKFRPFPETEMKSAFGDGIQITGETGDGKSCAMLIAEADLCDEQSFFDQAWVFGEKRTLLGEYGGGKDSEHQQKEKQLTAHDSTINTSREVIDRP